MSSLEINKIAGAVLVAGIAFQGFGILSEALIHPAKLEKTAIAIDIAPPVATASAPAAAEDPPVALLLASADTGRGQADVAKQGCVACHSFNEGGKAGLGPNLYGVLGGPHAHMEGYAYSAALKAKAGPWTYDELNAWLKKPAAYAPGTKMSYAGWGDAKGRADIIAYLRSLAHDPQPLPPVPAVTASNASASAAPAPGTAGGASASAAAPPPDAAAATQDPPIATLLASADVGAGQKQTLASGCVACHSFNEGGKAGLGPNLYGIVDGPHAHMEGYAYSAALKAKAGPWTYDELNAWLKKPATYAPGTKMSFAGLADPQKRANVIVYLRSLAATPAPLPDAAAK